MRRPLILFFNSFFGTFPDTSALAGSQHCDFTHDRSRLAEADAVIIHLPGCRRIWEARKYPGQLWVAWSLESDVTVPALRDPRFMRHFELTMTYRRDGDIWCNYLPEMAYPPDPANPMLAAPAAKSEPSPAVLFQSSPYDRSQRYRYLHQLMRRVRVDSYGKLASNRQPDGPDLGRATKLSVIARYKFCLSFENSISPDYVTEKFFDPLLAGTLPVYRGAPNVADFAPGPKSYIDVNDFSGPAELADYLNYLAGNEAAYGEYFQWKRAGFTAPFRALMAAARPLPLERLCDILLARPEVTGGNGPLSGRFSQPFYWRQWQPSAILQRLRKPAGEGGTWTVRGPGAP
jgi:hypothetical protein